MPESTQEQPHEPEQPEPLYELLGEFETAPAAFTPAAGTPVMVRIAMQVGGETREFEALATTSGDGYRLAGSLLGGLRGDADRWLSDRES